MIAWGESAIEEVEDAPCDESDDDDDMADDNQRVQYMVMLARSQRGAKPDRPGANTTERTQIRNFQASHVLKLLLPKNLVGTLNNVTVPNRDNQWRIVVCIGPLSEKESSFLQERWGTDVRGIISKAAQADVLSTYIHVTAYLDYENVFGPNFEKYVRRLSMDCIGDS